VGGLWLNYFFKKILFTSTYTSKTEKIAIHKYIIRDAILVCVMLNGKKTVDITISIHTDITLDTPFGSSFHPNFLIKGLCQNFIAINNQIGLCSNIVNN
jgi:hypothetical protein